MRLPCSELGCRHAGYSERRCFQYVVRPCSSVARSAVQTPITRPDPGWVPGWDLSSTGRVPSSTVPVPGRCGSPPTVTQRSIQLGPVLTINIFK